MQMISHGFVSAAMFPALASCMTACTAATLLTMVASSM